MPETQVPSRGRKAAAFLCGLILSLSLGVAALAGTLWFFGTDAPLLERWLDWDAVPASAGLTEADRAPIAKLVADTMAGRRSSFQYKGLFSDQAVRHMADCAPLFRQARTVGLAGFGVFLAALGASLILRDRKKTAKGMLLGVGLLLVAALALAVWGLADFDGLFTAFHRMMFTNDEWIFPADDLLVTLMPIGFFTRCAAVGGGLWLACLLALAGVAFLLIKNRREKHLT